MNAAERAWTESTLRAFYYEAGENPVAVRPSTARALREAGIDPRFFIESERVL